ncbi:MAG: glycosyl hydrolase family 28-related protein [Ferruginibacter sp.]
MRHNCTIILSLIAVLFSFNSLSQVISAARSTNWGLAGYNGTIPVYPVIKNITDFGGSGNGTTTNDAALTAAIASLNNGNGTIYFPQGTFLFHSVINLRAGLILKGDGSGSTTLLFDQAGVNDCIHILGNETFTIANITSSVAKEASSFVVDDASLFQVNDYIKIYQDNDASLITDSWAAGSVGQVIHIDNISGNTIFFSNPLRRNYLLANSPKIKRFEMITGVGIECLKIKRLDITSVGLPRANIYIARAANCWVRGIESDTTNFAHVQILNSTNIEITNCYFHGSFDYGTGKGYGICCELTSGDCLIENNIFKHLRHSMLLQSGANGNVFGYNYSIEPRKSETIPFDLSGDIVMHGNYPYMNLFEGNIVQNILIDQSHGKNGPFNTLFRNRAESYGIIISSGAGDSSNLVGNEITGTGIGKGNYTMSGNGNFQYGNNKNNTIIPTGTTPLDDKSYKYSSIPFFWNLTAIWPTIGISNDLNSGTIPAQDRYTAATDLSYCMADTAVIYIFNGNGNWDVPANWINNKIPPAVLSPGSQIIIDPVADGECDLNVPYTINPGVTITVATGKQFVVQGNLIRNQ